MTEQNPPAPEQIPEPRFPGPTEADEEEVLAGLYGPPDANGFYTGGIDEEDD